MKTTQFTDEQIIRFIKEAGADIPIKELCRSGGLSQPTFYKLRSKFVCIVIPDASVV